MALADERCVLLTTFRRDGRPVATPVWWVSLGDGSYGFYTSSASGKAKRLAHTDRVTVQPCNMRGVVKPGSSPLEGTARITAGGDLAAIRRRIKEKYGLQAKLAMWVTMLGATLRRKPFPYGDRGVIITL